MEFFNTHAAGELLQTQIKEREGYWQQFLINNRRKDRSPAYQIPFTRRGKAALYTREDLAAFLEWEKTRRIGEVKLTGRAAGVMRAYGIGEPGGSNYGRQFSHHVTFQFDEVLREFYMRLQIDEPFLVFKLPMQQAKQLRDELTEMIHSSERIAKKTLK